MPLDNSMIAPDVNTNQKLWTELLRSLSLYKMNRFILLGL